MNKKYNTDETEPDQLVFTLKDNSCIVCQVWSTSHTWSLMDNQDRQHKTKKASLKRFSIPGHQMGGYWHMILTLYSTKITIQIRPPDELMITLTDNSVRGDSQFLPSWPPETSLLFCHLDRVSVQPIQGGLTRGKYSNQPENETMKMLNGCYNTEWQGIRGMSLESESKSKFSFLQSPYWAFLWPVCVCPFSCAPPDSVR